MDVDAVRPTTWRRNPLIRFFASIRFGIATLVLILVYASIGSALAPVRGALELSEMQVFKHWLFLTLIVLFCVSLVLATLTRIKFKWTNAGALLTHAGLLLLIGGAWWYFATKVEGDVVLVSPRVELVGSDGRKLGNDADFVAWEGGHWEQFAPALGGMVRFEVTQTLPPHQPVEQAVVSVRFGDAAPQSVTLAANDPQPTMLGSGLGLRLRTYAAQDMFFQNDLPTLYYGEFNGELKAAPLHELPLHRERYLADEGELKDVRGNVVPSKRTWPHLALGALRIPTGWFERWRLPIHVPTPTLPFDVEITGYVPYLADLRGGVPIIQPLELRRPGQDRMLSAIRLKLTGRDQYEGWSETRWALFSPVPRVEPAAMGVIGAARPELVRMPDNKVYELVYSRWPHRLDTTLVPGRLAVNFMPGAQNVETWRSDFFVAGRDGVAQPAEVYTNQTYTVGPWTLFQANASGDHWSWTGLGVGNRRGMWPMMLGSGLITLGCLFAFYIKPVLKQRMRTALAAQLASDAAPSARPVQHPVLVK